jgi:hypothetical protein
VPSVSVVDELEARLKGSLRGEWFERADSEAQALAREVQHQRPPEDIPGPVVDLLAIADLSDFVLELETIVDLVAENRSSR